MPAPQQQITAADLAALDAIRERHLQEQTQARNDSIGEAHLYGTGVGAGLGAVGGAVGAPYARPYLADARNRFVDRFVDYMKPRHAPGAHSSLSLEGGKAIPAASPLPQRPGGRVGNSGYAEKAMRGVAGYKPSKLAMRGAGGVGSALLGGLLGRYLAPELMASPVAPQLKQKIETPEQANAFMQALSQKNSSLDVPLLRALVEKIRTQKNAAAKKPATPQKRASTRLQDDPRVLALFRLQKLAFSSPFPRNPQEAEARQTGAGVGAAAGMAAGAALPSGISSVRGDGTIVRGGRMGRVAGGGLLGLFGGALLGNYLNRRFGGSAGGGFLGQKSGSAEPARIDDEDGQVKMAWGALGKIFGKGLEYGGKAKSFAKARPLATAGAGAGLFVGGGNVLSSPSFSSSDNAVDRLQKLTGEGSAYETNLREQRNAIQNEKDPSRRSQLQKSYADSVKNKQMQLGFFTRNNPLSFLYGGAAQQQRELSAAKGDLMDQYTRAGGADSLESARLNMQNAAAAHAQETDPELKQYYADQLAQATTAYRVFAAPHLVGGDNNAMSAAYANLVKAKLRPQAVAPQHIYANSANTARPIPSAAYGYGNLD